MCVLNPVILFPLTERKMTISLDLLLFSLKWSIITSILFNTIVNSYVNISPILFCSQ